MGAQDYDRYGLTKPKPVDADEVEYAEVEYVLSTCTDDVRPAENLPSVGITLVPEPEVN